MEEAIKLKDPMTMVKEVVNLMTIYQEKLESMGEFASPEKRNWNFWDVRSKVPGFYCISPMNNWRGKLVFVQGVGVGKVIAVKKISDWYIPGIEFYSPVEKGHALSLRSEGQEGKEGHCLWVWLDKIKVIPSDQARTREI